IFERQSDQRFSIPGVGVGQNWLASAGLRPEKIDAAEVGYYGDWRALRVVLDVRAFDERIKDFVEIADRTVPASVGAINGTAPTFINGRTLRMRGIEYQATWRPFESTRVMLSQNFTDADFPTDGQFLSVPRHTTAIAWFQR